MGLKILHSADWHLDSPFAAFPKEERDNLRRNQRRLPLLIADICRKERCDLVLLAGDIFDGPYTRESLDSLRWGLEQCAVPVFIAPGNHDFCGGDSPWLNERWPKNVHIFTGGLSYADIPELDCRVYGAGYRSMDCPSLLQGFRAEGNSRYCIAVLHADPGKPNSPYCPIAINEVKESGLDYLALGHIHKADAFRAGSTVCAWPGCPMGRGWDETDEKGVIIAELGDTTTLRPIVLDLPQFHDLTVNVGQDPVQALASVLPAAGSRDFYRVTLTGTMEADAEKLRRVFPKMRHLELVDCTETVRDIWEDIEEDTLRGVFFRLLRDGQQQSDQPEVYRLAAEIAYKLLSGKEVELP